MKILQALMISSKSVQNTERVRYRIIAAITFLTAVMLTTLTVLACQVQAYADAPVYSIGEDIPVTFSKSSTKVVFGVRGSWGKGDVSGFTEDARRACYTVYCDSAPAGRVGISVPDELDPGEYVPYSMSLRDEGLVDMTGDDVDCAYTRGGRVAWTYMYMGTDGGDRTLWFALDLLADALDGGSVVPLTFRVVPHEHPAFVHGFRAASPGKGMQGWEDWHCTACGMAVEKGATGSGYSLHKGKTWSLASVLEKDFSWTGKRIRPGLGRVVEYGGSSSIGYGKLSKYKVKYPKRGSRVGTHYMRVTPKGKVAYRVVPRATKVTKVKRYGRKATVKWKRRTAQNDRYVISWSTDRRMRNDRTKTIRNVRRTSVTLKGLKRGKRYYVQVTCMKKVNGKWYESKWRKPTVIKAG